MTSEGNYYWARTGWRSFRPSKYMMSMQAWVTFSFRYQHMMQSYQCQKQHLLFTFGRKRPIWWRFTIEETFSLPLTSTPFSFAARTQPEQGSTDQFGLPISCLLTLTNDSCSRENSASHMNKELFSKEKLMLSNFKGVFVARSWTWRCHTFSSRHLSYSLWCRREQTLILSQVYPSYL